MIVWQWIVKQNFYTFPQISNILVNDVSPPSAILTLNFQGFTISFHVTHGGQQEVGAKFLKILGDSRRLWRKILAGFFWNTSLWGFSVTQTPSQIRKKVLNIFSAQYLIIIFSMKSRTKYKIRINLKYEII